MHTETMEIFLVSQWEYVSAYYSLSFQVSNFIGFIMRWMCFRGQFGSTNTRPPYLRATIR